MYLRKLPFKNTRNAKHEDTGDDVDDITEGKDTHQLVEIVLLVSEPEDDEDVANDSYHTNADLNMLDIVKDILNYKLIGIDSTLTLHVIT